MKLTVFMSSLLFFSLINFSMAQSPSGLKSVDYNSNHSVSEDAQASPSLSPEQMKMALETLQKAKAIREEQLKILEELDQDD